jgi:hypothetical protein
VPVRPSQDLLALLAVVGVAGIWKEGDALADSAGGSSNSSITDSRPHLDGCGPPNQERGRAFGPGTENGEPVRPRVVEREADEL